jgi:hypothetical protein
LTIWSCADLPLASIFGREKRLLQSQSPRSQNVLQTREWQRIARGMVMSLLKSVGACLLVCGLGMGVSARSAAQAPSTAESASAREAQGSRDGQHDFDFEIGTWKTHLKRLLHPLTGSKTWVEYDGTTVVRKVWDGRANLVELVADGPAGHFQGLNLRLYNPEAHQWSLNFANVAGGMLTQPTIGEFKNGRGEFYDQEPINGRAVLVRFVISQVSPDSCHFEQAFSADGGKTWEINWIADDTRVTSATR